ncbi:uncharacterized protein LOC119128650 [Syngnathus acus]|uniref:uncharacterized protein LOC119128650 n=1 Tax=Syngnathus acus TaxID=161584 RepID=UPI001885E57F|nr:uncharacterized protein LOC119128650 [Syngnathus acus]XP_037117128.1 uncharacterized protein LOC119128650 [Syngnathus acus]
MLNPKMQLALVLLLEFLCLAAAAAATAEAAPCSCDADNICTCNVGQKLELLYDVPTSNTIAWKKDGSVLSDTWAVVDADDSNKKATITSLKTGDEGTYAAIDGTTLVDCTVKVFFVKIVDRVTSVTVKRYTGNTVALHCLVGDDWKKFKTFEWKKDDKAISPSSKYKLKMKNAMLIIIGASASDNGDYCCAGKSFDGAQKLSATLPLRV